MCSPEDSVHAPRRPSTSDCYCCGYHVRYTEPATHAMSMGVRCVLKKMAITITTLVFLRRDQALPKVCNQRKKPGGKTLPQ